MDKLETLKLMYRDNKSYLLNVQSYNMQSASDFSFQDIFSFSPAIQINMVKMV